MRCILCDRPLTAAAVTLQGKAGVRAIGPKCAKRAGLLQPRARVKKPEPVQERDTSTVDWIEEVAA